MRLQGKKVNVLNHSIERLNYILQKGNYEEWAYLFGNKKEIIKRNFLAGISRGVGIGIGISVITAMIIIILQKIVTLNIPVIGEYIADIVEIVEKNR